MVQGSIQGKKRFTRKAWYAAGAAMLLAAMTTSALAIIPVISPSAGAQTADVLRALLGPSIVASIETASFRIQDAANQRLYALTGSRPGISVGTMQSASPAKPGNSLILLAPHSGRATANDGSAVTAQPQIGWQAYGPTVKGAPAMAQAVLNLDPQRPYAGIALVRMDLSQMQLHVMPGFLEPSHTAIIQKEIPNAGLTPASDVSHLVAGFNGGFKAINGQYGMMVNGVTLLPPVPGIATLAIYKDGHVQIGTWGSDLNYSPDMIAFRQNCPPIIQAGQINTQVAVDNRVIWGSTIGNKEITWRTAVGLSQDGRYLIYAVGNATTVSTLAQALQEAGAYNAMQLDINQHYAHFVTYQAGTDGSPHAVQLLTQMENIPTLYLVAHSRDYFYLTSK